MQNYTAEEKKEKNFINANKFNKLWKLYIKFMDEKIVV